jgi:hypothetical protein
MPRDLGLPEPSAEEARHVIGLELSRVLRHVVPDLPPKRLPSLVACRRHHCLAADRTIRLFPGIRDLGRQYRRRRIGGDPWGIRARRARPKRRADARVNNVAQSSPRLKGSV